MAMVTTSPSAARAVDLGQLGELLAQAVDLRVDLLVGGLGAGHLDPQAAVARHLDAGPDLDDGVEGDRALLLAGGDLDLRGGDDVDVVLA